MRRSNRDEASEVRERVSKLTIRLAEIHFDQRQLGPAFFERKLQRLLSSIGLRLNGVEEDAIDQMPIQSAPLCGINAAAVRSGKNLVALAAHRLQLRDRSKRCGCSSDGCLQLFNAE